ncbi:DpnD/PcfM-like protein [Epsilonproteobacteria bacterium SCGC AD-311-C15]|jgi:hypothetical protein|nr:DpnD/PcfM-like protein [Epsilonproteobacteria bacterium SCGC AD-311-C15]
MKIDIKITEILSRIVSVDAKSIDEAIEHVKEMYNREEIVLDYSDFDGNVTIDEYRVDYSSSEKEE